MAEVDTIHNWVFGDRVFIVPETKYKIATIISIHADYGYVIFTTSDFNPDAPYRENCDYIRVERVPVSSLLGLFPSPKIDYAILRMRRNNSCLEGVLTECRRQGLPQVVSLNLQAQLMSQLEREDVTEDVRARQVKGSSQESPVNDPKPDACEPDGRFYVYRTDGKGPKYIHLSYENALQEAKRLARETKDCARFEVLRIVASVETIMQTQVNDYR
jgi:hypothetical protein